MKKSRLLVFVLLLTSGMNLLKAQCLSGTYTIGGNSPSYATFNAAVTALTANGICGPVLFNIRDTSYREQISIPAIAGCSSTNTITFQSESGDSSKVILFDSTTAAKNYVVHLNGCDYIRFKKITIKSIAASSNGKIIELLNGASNNAFENNILTGVNTTSNSPALAVINYSGDSNHNNLFSDNRIENGSYGFYAWGSTSFYVQNTVIKGNDIKGQYYSGIYLVYHDAPNVDSNTITPAASPSSSYLGIYFSLCNNGYIISRNKISGRLVNGLSIYKGTHTPGNPGLVFNNYISTTPVSASASSQGISLSGGGVNIYFNNVLVPYKSGASDAALYLNLTSGDSAINIFNNNFVSTSGAYAVNGNTVTGINMDRNNLFTTGTNLCKLSTTNYANLALWVTASKKDSNSVSVNPRYTTQADLGINEKSLDGKGIPAGGILQDIEGDVRDTFTPDIGADEFVVKNTDVGIISIDKPDSLYCTKISNDFYVTVKNFGIDTLYSVQISWLIDNITMPVYSWSGTLLPGNSTASFKIGSYSFNTQGNHKINAWTYKPNNGVDVNLSNDTVSITKKLVNRPIDLGKYIVDICPGGSKIVDAGSGYVAYQWSTGNSTQSITINSTGIYKVAVTDPYGCTSSDSITINILDGKMENWNFPDSVAVPVAKPSAFSKDWTSVAAIDFNRDDNIDLTMSGNTSQNATYWFTNNLENDYVHAFYSTQGSDYTISWGNFNNDTVLDCLNGNNVGGKPHISITKSNSIGGNLNISTNLYQDSLLLGNEFKRVSNSVCWVDYNNDGFLDVSIMSPDTNVLLHSDSAKKFIRDTLWGKGMGQAWTDFDNDGDQDLFYTDSSTCNLMKNDGNGKFTDVTSTAFPPVAAAVSYGGSWGDYDNDGFMDLFIAREGANLLFKNNGNGTFSSAAGAGTIITDNRPSRGSAWGDLDNDGYLDLFVTNFYNQPDTINYTHANSLYHNNGNGTFSTDSRPELKSNGSQSWKNMGTVTTDIEIDGDLEIVFLAKNNMPNIIKNHGTCGNNWLVLNLTGVISNKSALGARAYAYTTINGKPQVLTREVSGQTGYAGQNGFNLSFGLGTATVVDSLKIFWPSGIRQRFDNVTPNQFMKIIEKCTDLICKDVWPGDVNCDQVADNKDLLPVGIYYGDTGPARDSISNKWIAHTCAAWGKTQSNGMNIRHADCNGDGTINDNDTLAVSLNYNLFHAKKEPIFNVSSANPDLYFIPSKKIIKPGEWVDISVAAGKSSTNFSKLYGIAYDISYTSPLVEPGSVTLNHNTSSVINIPAAKFHSLSKIFESSGKCDGAAVRTDHKSSTAGFGSLATLRLRARTTISTSSFIVLKYTDYLAVDSAGNELPFNLLPDTIYIDPVGIKNTSVLSSGLSVFPNPSGGQTFISYTLSDNAHVILEIINPLGQKVSVLADEKQPAGEYRYSFSAKKYGYPEGVYFVRLKVGDDLYVERLVELK